MCGITMIYMGGKREFMEAIDRKYGKPTDLKDFSRKAQIVNYDSHRAMMEAWNSKMWNSTSGLLLWMSHRLGPVWFGRFIPGIMKLSVLSMDAVKRVSRFIFRKNLDDQKVVVVNTSLKKIKGLKLYMKFIPLKVSHCLNALPS